MGCASVARLVCLITSGLAAGIFSCTIVTRDSGIFVTVLVVGCLATGGSAPAGSVRYSYFGVNVFHLRVGYYGCRKQTWHLLTRIWLSSDVYKDVCVVRYSLAIIILVG